MSSIYQDDADRISKMPDHILGDILSRISTKEGLQTSVLSKRWILVWTNRANFELIGGCGSCSNCRVCSAPDKKNLCMYLIERVLKLNGKLQKFSITLNQDYEIKRVCSWIRAVMMRDVEEISISLWEGSVVKEELDFPLVLKNLKSLNMTNWDSILLSVCQPVHLPHLKKLNLCFVNFADNESLNKLIDGCPALEELDIKFYAHLDEKDICIQSASLKSLKLHVSYICDKHRKISIKAKNLERLDMKADKGMVYDLQHLPLLDKVTLHQCFKCSGSFIDGSRLVGLLRMVSNTKYLKLSSHTMSSLEYTMLSTLPFFPNLDKLEVRMLNSWTVLTYLFERAPSISSFILHKGWFLGNEQPAFRTPRASMLKLQEVKFTGFKGTANELKLMKYIRNTAPALKEFTIEDA